jgi:pSer/pThr/pTyr-binding forkhead associated (FHA) protein
VSLGSPGNQQSFEFKQPFRIGRVDQCEVCVKSEYVSRLHAEVVFENGDWWIRDLNSSNGLYLDGSRVERSVLSRPTTIRLGIEGPELFFKPRGQTQPAPRSEPAEPDLLRSEIPSATGKVGLTNKKAFSDSGAIPRKYVEHYFGKSANNTTAGEHTMYVRRAFAKVQSQQRRTHGSIIAVLIFAAMCAGGHALYERRQLQRQRAMAEDLFYAMKSLDLEIAKLEDVVAQSGNQQDAQHCDKEDQHCALRCFFVLVNVISP